MRDNSTMHFLERLELDQMENDWTAPDEFPDLTNCKYIAIDLETRDPNLMKMGSGSVRGDGEIVGIAVAVEGWSGYFPIAHEGGGNMDRALVLDWFEEVLHTTATKIFHNAMYDVSWIRSLGFHINGGIIDTMIAASLVNENRYRFDLNSLGWDYVGQGKNETELNILTYNGKSLNPMKIYRKSTNIK